MNKFFLFSLLCLFYFTSAHSEEHLLNKCFLLEYQYADTEELLVVAEDKRKFDYSKYDNYYVKIDLNVNRPYAKLVVINNDENIRLANEGSKVMDKTIVKFFLFSRNDLK